MRSRLKVLRWIGALAAILALVSCGGGSSGDNNSGNETPPTPTNPTNPTTPTTPTTPTAFGAGTLVEGVRILTDSENALLVNQSGTQFVYNGDVPFGVGQVVLGSDSVYRVANVRRENGRTIVESGSVAIEDIFEELRIQGDFDASQATVETDAADVNPEQPQRLRPQASTGSFNWPKLFTQGATSASANLSGSVGAKVDYVFVKSQGGLQSARVDVRSSLALTAQLKVDVTAALPSAEVQLGTIRIPVPVLITDRLLNRLGLRLVSINVPVSSGLAASSQFKVDSFRKVAVEGEIGLRYDLQNGASVSDSITANIEEGSFLPAKPSGAPALASFAQSAELYVRMRPALAFLNEVALLGADIKLAGRGVGVLQVGQEDLKYCFTGTPSANIEVNGFFKSILVKEIATPSYGKILFTGSPVLVGECLPPTLVSAVPGAATFGKPVAFDTRVQLDPAFKVNIPRLAPSGTLTVKVGERSCVSTLTAAAELSAVGRCTLSPLVAGEAVVATLTYSGDANYGASTQTIALPIAKSASFVATSTGPSPSLDRAMVSFSGAVAPMPAGEGDPAGAISFYEGEGGSGGGTLVCVAQIASAGVGQCSTAVSGVGVKRYYAVYSGNADFLSSTSTTVSHTVKSAESTYASTVLLSGPADVFDGSCTGTYQMDGTATVRLDAANPNQGQLTLVGAERVDTTCYNQTSPVNLTLPVVVTDTTIQGNMVYPFTCAPPCVTGQLQLSANLRRQTGQADIAVDGTIVYTNTNQTPFRASSSATVVLSRLP